MVRRVVVLVLGCCIVVSSFSQVISESSPAEESNKPADAQAKPDENPSVTQSMTQQQGQQEQQQQPQSQLPNNARGDKIFLKSGSTMEGFQIVRETPTFYEVEVVRDSVTVRIPRRQVERVEYDDFDPLSNAKTQPVPKSDKPEPILLPGHEMPPQFLKDISDPPFQYQQQDFITILDELAKRAQASITIDDSIRKFPAEMRTWTIESKPGMTTAAVLEMLVSTFDYLRVVYERGGAVILAKTPPPSPTESLPTESQNPQTNSENPA